MSAGVQDIRTWSFFIPKHSGILKNIVQTKLASFATR